MKITKGLKKIEWLIIYQVVNNPPSGIPQHSQADIKRLKSLFDSITKHVEDEKGDYDFNLVNDKDLALNESEWNELKKCFELTGYPSMQDAKNGENAETKIKNAIEKKEK